jgi:hypothetical protein
VLSALVRLSTVSKVRKAIGDFAGDELTLCCKILEFMDLAALLERPLTMGSALSAAPVIKLPLNAERYKGLVQLMQSLIQEGYPAGLGAGDERAENLMYSIPALQHLFETAELIDPEVVDWEFATQAVPGKMN